MEVFYFIAGFIALVGYLVYSEFQHEKEFLESCESKLSWSIEKHTGDLSDKMYDMLGDYNTEICKDLLSDD